MKWKITKSDKVVDVFDELVYCRYEPQSKSVLTCTEAEKQGVVSKRRDTYYHVTGWPEFGIDVQDVALSEISDSEYEELKAQLDKEDAESEAITQLREKLNGHDISIDDLEDAVLELAEIIGG